VSLSNIGVVLFEEDRLQDAAVYYTESLSLSRAIGDKRSQVRALHNLAIVDRELGRLAAARAGIEESLATRQELGDKRGVVMARVELGIVLLAQGHIEAARKAEEEALRLARETRLKPGEAQALYQLGEIAVAEDQLVAARTYHQQALALRLEMQETRTVLESQSALVALALHEGRPADAETEARRVLAALGPASKDPTRIAVELLTARALLARGDKGAAARVLTTARRLAENSERIDVRRSLAMVDAELDAAQGRPGRARERLIELRTVLAGSGMVLAELESRLLLLQIERAGGKPTVPADARALETDARAQHAALVARRVQGP
jgi:tetratricopeptide (TPR) repeat protein